MICENRNWKTPLYRDLRCAFQITFLRRDLAYTRSFLRIWILIQNAHLELNFKIRTLPSCENSHKFGALSRICAHASSITFVGLVKWRVNIFFHISQISAVYTGIKKPESFSHSGFSLKVARQLPLNTPKKPESKKPTFAAWFFETPPKFHWFFANVNARSNLAGIIRVFGHVIHDLQRNHPTAARDVMRTTRVRSKVERSRPCAPLTKTSVWDSGFFTHALFVPKTPNVMGFSGSVNGTTKNPGFLDFGFCQCKWAYIDVFRQNNS